MTVAGALLAGATLSAILDWVAVSRSSKTEFAWKPATMVLLIGAAVAMDPQDQVRRNWFAMALLCGLVGDVLLMLPREQFIGGLVAFLAGHLAYIVGFLSSEINLGAAIAGLVLFGLIAVSIGRALLAKMRSFPKAPVAIYILVITVMASLAVGSLNWTAVLGASLFMFSDGVLAWNKFAAQINSARLIVITTYHAAQILLVLSLLSS